MMKKLILPSLAILVLLAIFAITYNAVNGVTPNNQNPDAPMGFNSDDQFVGQVGGLHYLRNGIVSDQGDFQRFTIETQLNRASILEDTIATPYTTAVVAKQGGKNVITLKLLDTTRMYIEGDRVDDVYTGVNGTVAERLPVTKITVAPSTEEGQQIQVEVDEAAVSYKLATDPQNPSHIWLDILK